MDPRELEPFFGQLCLAVVFCRACRRPHAQRGMLEPARRPGDITLDGITYPTSDVVSVNAEEIAVHTGSSRAALLPWLAAGWLALMAISRLMAMQ